MGRLTVNQGLLGLAALVLAALLLTRLSPLVGALMLAVLLAFWGQPSLRRLERLGLPHTLATSLVFLGLMTVLALTAFIVLPLLARQFDRLLTALPTALAWSPSVALPGPDAAPDATTPGSEGWFNNGVSGVFGVGRDLFAGLGYLALIAVAGFYLLRDWAAFTTGIARLMPRAGWRRVRPLLEDAQGMLAVFLQAQLPALLILSLFYTLSLAVIGVELALLIGVLAGVASLVPYMGVVLGLSLAIPIVGVQGLGVVQLLAVVVVLALGQWLTSLYLLPRWVGDRRNLHPLAVIVTVLTGVLLLGWVGALLAVPAAALANAAWVRSAHRPSAAPPPPDPAQPDEPVAAVDESMRQEDA